MLNGRFLGRPTTGVDRSALELTRALVDLQKAGGFQLSVGVPPKLAELAQTQFEGLVDVDVIGRDLPGHLWEQLHLARARRNAWLLSFCNTGPIFRSKQAVLIHDAQFRTQSASYSRSFRLIYSLLIPILSRRAASAFTVSRYSRRILESERIAPAGKLRLLPNGSDHFDRIEADPSALDRFGLSPQGYFLAVGSPAPHKNLQMLYDAVLGADDLNAPLVVVGAADSRVLRLARMRESPQVRSVGRVSDDELKSLYRGALALCLPSLTEGFGLAAAEAMRCGGPVLAAHAGALPEVCRGAAVLIPPTDGAAWVRELRRIESDRGLRDSLRRAGLHRATELTWRSSAERLVMHLRTADAPDERVDRQYWIATSSSRCNFSAFHPCSSYETLEA